VQFYSGSTKIDLIQLYIQIVLDQLVLNLIQIRYIQICYIQFCVKIGLIIQILVHQFAHKTCANKNSQV
jgi:hypothetical protein